MSNFPVNPGNAAVTSSAESDTTTTANSGAGPAPAKNDLICDRTGFRVARQRGLVEEWTGAQVRRESLDPRHPQDFVRTRSAEGEGSGGGAFSSSTQDLYGTGVLNPVTGEIEVDNPGVIRLPPGPFTLSGTGISDSQIDLSWTAPQEPIFDVIKFVVFREVDASGTAIYLTQVDGDTLTYSDGSVDRTSESYSYYVLAIDAGNLFRWSNGATLTITGSDGDTETGNSGEYPHPGGGSGIGLPGSSGGPPGSGDSFPVTDEGTLVAFPTPYSVDVTVGNGEFEGWADDIGGGAGIGSVDPDPVIIGSSRIWAIYGGFLIEISGAGDDPIGYLQSLGYTKVSIETSVDNSSTVVDYPLSSWADTFPVVYSNNAQYNLGIASGMNEGWVTDDISEVKTVTFS